MSDYHLQSAVPLHSCAYIHRPFEDEVFQKVVKGDWVTLLGPRQHGKTTSLYRIKHKLIEAGISTVCIDLQTIPPLNEFQELLKWFTSRIASGIAFKISTFPPKKDLNQLDAWLNFSVPQDNQPIVIMIDEASGITNDEWRNSFFGQIRAISNMRADAAPEHLSARVRFIFSGSFRLESLVTSANSPFNVSHIINTRDLSLENSIKLIQQIEGDRYPLFEEFVPRAFELVSGHPFLLQHIFSYISAVEVDINAKYEEITHSLQYEYFEHTQSIFRRVLTNSMLITIVASMARDGFVRYEPGNHDHSFLEVIGIAIRKENRLVFRNNLYQFIAQNSPQLAENPLDPNIENVNLFIPSEDQYDFMVSSELKEIALSYEQGAIRAFNSGNYRLACVSFGASMEAILMDWIENQSISDRQLAIGQAQQKRNLQLLNYEDINNSRTWRLFNLLKVACELTDNININIHNPPDILRDWRNFIHPGKILDNYKSESATQPEAFAASGLFNILKRDIRSN